MSSGGSGMVALVSVTSSLKERRGVAMSADDVSWIDASGMESRDVEEGWGVAKPLAFLASFLMSALRSASESESES